MGKLGKKGGEDDSGVVVTTLEKSFPLPSSRRLGRESDARSGMGRVTAKKDSSFRSERVVLGDVISWLEVRMDDFVGRLCKTLPSGRVLPLPTSMTLLSQLFSEAPKDHLKLLRCLCLSLNSLNGEGTQGPEKASDFQACVLSGLLSDCVRVSSWETEEEAPTWACVGRM